MGGNGKSFFSVEHNCITVAIHVGRVFHENMVKEDSPARDEDSKSPFNTHSCGRMDMVDLSFVHCGICTIACL